MSILQSLQDAGELSALSVHFARFIARIAGIAEEDPVVLAAAVLSQSNQRGDVCLRLPVLAGQLLFPGAAQAERTRAPALEPWCEALRRCPCVGSPGTRAPLVLDGTRLYLQRFWRHEVAVAQGLLDRLASAAQCDEALLRSGLSALFEDAEGTTAPDWQKLASALAVQQRFAVISGGPGTGKTTTVVKVLSLLLAQQPALRIALAAPTGKAAARMVESLRAARRSLALAPEVLARLPDVASTLHRLLGWQPDLSRYPYRRHRDNPLPMDCLIIDEASMIDLPMMHAVLDALPPDARLILLGDRDQLASVEAGNVLGDITGHGRSLGYSPALIAGFEALGVSAPGPLQGSAELAPIQDAIAILQRSHRFGANSGIGRLSRLVNGGLAQDGLALLASAPGLQDAGPDADLLWLQTAGLAHASLRKDALDWAVAHYTQYLVCKDVETALQRFAQCRVLCAAHEGALGEVAVNAQLAERLRHCALLEAGPPGHGTPVMITVNDYELELYNGDIGLLWKAADGSLEACFPQLDAQVRRIPAASLPAHVPAWALTVHKSQGSEFDEVLLILPEDVNSPLLLRELLYTGITRARRRLLLQCTAEAFERACTNPATRSSGLAARLGWGKDA